MTQAHHEELAFAATGKVEASRKLAFDGVSFDPANTGRAREHPRDAPMLNLKAHGKKINVCNQPTNQQPTTSVLFCLRERERGGGGREILGNFGRPRCFA
jgi:hypothetical protein